MPAVSNLEQAKLGVVRHRGRSPLLDDGPRSDDAGRPYASEPIIRPKLPARPADPKSATCEPPFLMSICHGIADGFPANIARLFSTCWNCMSESVPAWLIVLL